MTHDDTRGGLISDDGSEAVTDWDAQCRWRWPSYLDGWEGRRLEGDATRSGRRWPWLRTLGSAAFIEWRYFAVLAPAFHGIVGMSLVNPERRFSGVAEGGLLVIVAAVLEQGSETNARPGAVFNDARADSPEDVPGAAPTGAAADRPWPELCWMHLFEAGACSFDGPSPGALSATDSQCTLSLRLSGPGTVRLRLETARGLALCLEHRGLSGNALEPVVCRALDAPLPALLGNHWQVECGAPIARCDGEVRFARDALEGLAEFPGGTSDSYATPPLRAALEGGRRSFVWRAADGYAEHSFGVRPLLLHGWDFLFCPKWATGDGIVLQTYRGSRRLRYLEVFWRERGGARHHRFEADQFQLSWPQRTFDPVLGVWRPLRRLIQAQGDGLRLRIDNQVLHRIPLLRRHRLAVRHFFISEEIGVADWRLEDADGHCLADVQAQPCGGELAHFRWRAPLREA